jgi:glucokinase
VTPEGEVLNEVRYPTAATPQRLVSSISKAIAEVRDSYEVEGVCLAVPELILAQENRVVFSPNLNAIENIPLKERLEPAIELPLTIENDASAAGWGEFRFGAGKGVEHMIFVTKRPRQ